MADKSDNKNENMAKNTGEDMGDAWPWEDDDAIDPELLELSQGTGRDSILRPILMLIVLVMAGMIIHDWREELAYFMSSSTPIKVGAIHDFPSRAAQDKSWTPDIPHNRYIELEGLPSKRSISDTFKYFKLVGGEVYIELLREDYNDDPLKKEAKGRPKADIDRAFFRGRGRALSFAAIPGRYAGIKNYYKRNYNTQFCVDLDATMRAQLMHERKETIKTMWRKRFDEASPQERADKNLAQNPTAKELKDMLKKEPLCVDAWLIQINKPPSAHWWYVALSALFVLFMIVDFIFLIKWLKKFFTPDDL